MKAPDFRYERPTDVEAALALLADGDAAVLAGGQSLMPMMNFRLARPQVLVDLNRIDGLAGIAEDGEALRIGAMTRYADLAGSDLIATYAPLIARALPHIAHPAIRNRGTIGGSVALADPAAEMPALLMAMGAQIALRSTSGMREVAADDFFLGLYETARAEDELVTEIIVPKPAPGTRHGFYELARRHGDYAMAGVALAVGEAVRVAFFAVSDHALRAPEAEAALASGDIDAAAAGLEGLDFQADPNANVATKKHLAGVVLRRAWAGSSTGGNTA